MRPLGLASTVLSLTALLVSSGSAAAQPAPSADDTGSNVQITIAFGRVDEASAASRRVFKLIASAGGPPARMLIGWRMPIPSSRTGSGGGETDTPVTSYVYQNVGVTADLQVKLLGAGRMLLTGQLESSGTRAVEEPQPGQEDLPIIGTFQQALHLVLEEGKALRVAEVPDPDGGRLYCELEARVIR